MPIDAHPRRDLHRRRHRGAARAHPRAADGGARRAPRRRPAATRLVAALLARVARSRRGGAARPARASPTSTSPASSPSTASAGARWSRAPSRAACPSTPSSCPTSRELAAGGGRRFLAAAGHARASPLFVAASARPQGHARRAGGRCRRHLGVPDLHVAPAGGRSRRRGMRGRMSGGVAGACGTRGPAPAAPSRRCSATPGSSRTIYKPAAVPTPGCGAWMPYLRAELPGLRPFEQLDKLRASRGRRRLEEGRGSRGRHPALDVVGDLRRRLDRRLPRPRAPAPRAQGRAAAWRCGPRSTSASAPRACSRSTICCSRCARALRGPARSRARGAAARALARGAGRRVPGHRPGAVRHRPRHLGRRRPAGVPGGRSEAGDLPLPRRRRVRLPGGPQPTPTRATT